MKLLIVKKEFIKELNKNLVSKEFIEECKKAGKLFKIDNKNMNRKYF